MLNDTLTYGLNFKKKFATGLNKSGRTAYFGQVLCYDIGKLNASSTTIPPGTATSKYYVMTDNPGGATVTSHTWGFSGIVQDAIGKPDGDEVHVQLYGICQAYSRVITTTGFNLLGARLFVPLCTTNVSRILETPAQSTAKVVGLLDELMTTGTAAADLAEGAGFPTQATDTAVLTNYTIQLVDILFNGIEGMGR